MLETRHSQTPTSNQFLPSAGMTSIIATASDSEDPYESLSATYSLWYIFAGFRVHMAAGAAAGLAEHCALFPVDSVKTRMQSLCHCPVVAHSPTPIHGVASMVRREGWRRPLRGINAVAAGAVPAHAFYFTIYEKTKSFLTGNTYSHWNTWAYGAAGVCATVAHDLVMNPAEVVKQRMQMFGSPYGRSLECVRCVYRTEGIRAFYRSYSTQLLMNIPFQTIHFMVYEFWQQLLNPEHLYDPKTHLIAGGLAGGLAAAVTTPLDCIKTVLNTQQAPNGGGGPNIATNVQGHTFVDKRPLLSNAFKNHPSSYSSSSYHGIPDAIASIYATRSVGGFFTGISARVLFQVPATALSWSVYELFKFLLDTNEEGKASRTIRWL